MSEPIKSDIPRSKQGRLEKLKHLESPNQAYKDAEVHVRQFVEGIYPNDPQIGEIFIIYGSVRYEDRAEYLRTTPLRSIWVVGDASRDKLILPDSFPDRETLQFPDEVNAGDILFATLNSVYWLKPDRKG